MRRAVLGVLVAAFVARMGFAQTGPPQEGSTPGFVPEIAREAAGEGNAAFAAGDHKRAVRAYRKVLELVPGNLVGLVNLGVAEFASGNLEEAEAVLKQAVQQRIDTAPAWLTLGILYMDQGRLDEAHAALAQAILYDPRNARARNYLGVVIGRKGWLDGAQSELRLAVEIDPSYSDAHFNLAYFYLERKPPLIELARRHYHISVDLGATRDPEIEGKLRAGTFP
jgi:tetratricopeptide (TPR) repeat protein